MVRLTASREETNMSKQKRVPKNSIVKYKTRNAWGVHSHKGTVLAFVPRNSSALVGMPKRAKVTQFKGSRTSSMNDRYLIRFEDGDRVFFRAPRAPRIEAAFFGAAYFGKAPAPKGKTRKKAA